MPATEEQHVDIQDTAEAQDADKLRDLARVATLPNLYQELRKLHGQAKKALDSDLDEEASQAALEEISDASDALQTMVADASEALNELQELLAKTEGTAEGCERR